MAVCGCLHHSLISQVTLSPILSGGSGSVQLIYIGVSYTSSMVGGGPAHSHLQAPKPQNAEGWQVAH